VFEAVTLCKAGDVQPVTGPAFAVMRAVQQPVDQLFISVGRLVCQEFFDFCRCGGQADQIKISATDINAFTDLVIGAQSFFLLLCENELVDITMSPLILFHLGNGGLMQRLERPEFPVIAADLHCSFISGSRCRQRFIEGSPQVNPF